MAGEGAETLRRLERLSASGGLAYQILDDFKDSLMGVEETGKTAGRDAGLGRPNLPDLAGPQRALGHLRRLLGQSRAIVDALGVQARERWAPLASLQGFLESEARDVARRLASGPAASWPARRPGCWGGRPARRFWIGRGSRASLFSPTSPFSRSCSRPGSSGEERSACGGSGRSGWGFSAWR